MELALNKQEALIAEAIVAERRRQIKKYGGAEHDDKHSPSDWIDLIQSVALKARGGLACGGHNFAAEMTSVAALAIAAIASQDRMTLKTQRGE
jgi:hypothetical protein